jgi:Flp pilus assembly protein TadG
MLKLLQRFERDEAGSMAVIFGLAIIPAVFLAGAAIDYSRSTQSRAQLQSAVDNSALSVLMGPDGQRLANANAIVGSVAGLIPSVSVAGTPKEVVVTATGSLKTAVLNAARVDSIAIGARAKAIKLYQGPPPCILALDKLASGAVTFTGSSDFKAKDCVVQSNSSHGSGMVLEGSGTPVAAGFCSVGGVATTKVITPPPRSYCEPMEDPFKALPRPYSSACSFNNVVVEPKQTLTLKPGVYCGGLTLKGTATLEPGIYVVKNGNLAITSQSTVRGNGVMFYLTGTNAGFTFDAGGVLDLRAATDGTYGGLLVFQDNNSNPNFENKLAGGSDTIIIGGIYTPTQKVTLAGGSGFGQQSSYMPVIANQIRVSGSTTTQSDLTGVNLAAPLPKSFSGVRLVE